MKNFAPNSKNTNAQALADYLPDGELFIAKNIDESNFRRLLNSFAIEVCRAQELLYSLSVEYDLTTTKTLIDDWEKALGIPDDCFNTNCAIEQRRKQCIAKLAKMNLTNKGDWISLAKFLGYNIAIEPGKKYITLPFILPFILGSTKSAKFTMIIRFLDLDKPANIFPLKLPFLLGGSANIIKCLFNNLKPANVRLIFKYRDEP